MKQLWDSFKIAFSMYSRIPMPRSQWTPETKAYAMGFFPWVGVVIGAVFFGLFCLTEWIAAHGILDGSLFRGVVLTLTPLALTGGIHMDGFLDTRDALSAYAPKERRLEILKDPHTGAFAVISCGMYLIGMLGLYGVLSPQGAAVVSLGFVLSRTLSGLSVLCFPKAKKEGLAADFAAASRQKILRVALACYLILAAVGMVLAGGLSGALSLLFAGIMFGYYKWMSRQKFGGITGDLAGYFLQLCELWIAAGAVLGAVLPEIAAILKQA